MLQFGLNADTPYTIFHTSCSCFMAGDHSQDQDVVGLSRRELLALVLDRVKGRACSIHRNVQDHYISSTNIISSINHMCKEALFGLRVCSRMRAVVTPT